MPHLIRLLFRIPSTPFPQTFLPLLLLTLFLLSALHGNAQTTSSEDQIPVPKTVEWTVKEKTIQLGEYTFQYDQAGDPDNDPVIFLHGWPETKHMWSELLPEVAKAHEGFFCIAPNMRGISPGAVAPKVKDYHIKVLVDDVIALADSLGFERFHLVGHDWGSAIGWGVVKMNKKRIKSWTALSVPHVDAFSEAIRTDEDQKKKSGYMKTFQLRGIPKWYLLKQKGKAMKSVWGQSSEKEKAAYWEVYGNKKQLKASLNYYRANYKILKKGKGYKVGPIYTHTLFVWGNEDMAVGRKSVELAEQYMKKEYKVIELEAGHWLVQEKPEEVKSAIISQLRKYD